MCDDALTALLLDPFLTVGEAERESRWMGGDRPDDPAGGPAARGVSRPGGARPVPGRLRRPAPGAGSGPAPRTGTT